MFYLNFLVFSLHFKGVEVLPDTLLSPLICIEYCQGGVKMNFTDEDLKIIVNVFDILINSIDVKKHKTKQEILTLNSLTKINNKIMKYLED